MNTRLIMFRGQNGHMNRYINSLLKGNSVEQAYAKAKENLKNNLIKSYNQNDPDISKYLWWDMVHFRYDGLPDAKLEIK